MISKPIQKLGRFLLEVFAFILTIYGTIYFVLDFFGLGNVTIDPIPLVAGLLLFGPLIISLILAYQFTYKKPLSNIVIAMMIAISPLYLMISSLSYDKNTLWENTAKYQNDNTNYLQSSRNTSETLANKVERLEKETSLLTSPISTLTTAYNKSKFFTRKSHTEKLFNGVNNFLPTLEFYVADENRLSTTLNLEIIDLREASTVQVSPDELSNGGSPDISNLRPVTIDGKEYAFISYLSGEGLTGEDGCTRGGAAINDILIIEERNLAIRIIREESEESCPGTPTKIIETPDRQTIEELLRIVESIKFAD